MIEENGNRTHEPSLRELTAELDGQRSLMDERDRRYGEQFNASKEAVKAALDANKELTSQAFLASKEAINKAETASNANDAKNNEFRSQLKDQTSTFPTRIEVDSKVTSVADRLDEFKKDLEKYKDQQALEIRGLRETRAGVEAAKVQVVENRQRDQWSTSTILYVVFGIIGTLMGMISTITLLGAAVSGHLK
jgi:small-conductance mechanosensitive channel